MESLEEETKYSLTRKASVPSVQLTGVAGQPLKGQSAHLNGGCYSWAPLSGRQSQKPLPGKVSEYV